MAANETPGGVRMVRVPDDRDGQRLDNFLLLQLKGAAAVNGDVYVSIIPFNKDVNVGKSNYNMDWIDWEEWDDDNGENEEECKYVKTGKSGKKKTTLVEIRRV